MDDNGQYAIYCFGTWPLLYGPYPNYQSASEAFTEHMHGENTCDNNVEEEGHGIESLRSVKDDIPQ